LSRRDPHVEDAGSSFQLSTEATQLMDQSKVEASSKGMPEEVTAVAANDQDCDEPSFIVEDAVDFKEAISRQAAARAARFANRPPLTDDMRRQAIRKVERQEYICRHHVLHDRRRPSVAVSIGKCAARYGAIVYCFVRPRWELGLLGDDQPR
jgi:DNA topoisomerase VI subunit B